MGLYTYNAYTSTINCDVISHVKEGCGIRSIARLLNISVNTAMSRIKRIAAAINKPIPAIGRTYEMDELKTYIKNKREECWVIYALDKQTGEVIDFKAGRRTNANLKVITDTLLISNCKKIYTDGLMQYRQIIPSSIHIVKRYSTNKIERKNLNLRTHLKRLNRKTICYSKDLLMLESCLKIYFWYHNACI
jgi:IS1 family transposase